MPSEGNTLRNAFKIIEPVSPKTSRPLSGTAYWIRLFAYEHQDFFGDRSTTSVYLNETGHILATEWLRLAQHRQGIRLEDWTVMPNSVQGILLLPVDMKHFQDYFTLTTMPPPRLLSAFVASFKAATATRINLARNQPGAMVWQRGYQQKWIKDEQALERARQRLARLAA